MSGDAYSLVDIPLAHTCTRRTWAGDLSAFPCSPDHLGTVGERLSGDSRVTFQHPSPLLLKDTLTLLGRITPSLTPSSRPSGTDFALATRVGFHQLLSTCQVRHYRTPHPNPWMVEGLLRPEGRGQKGPAGGVLVIISEPWVKLT